MFTPNPETRVFFTVSDQAEEGEETEAMKNQ